MRRQITLFFLSFVLFSFLKSWDFLIALVVIEFRDGMGNTRVVAHSWSEAPTKAQLNFPRKFEQEQGVTLQHCPPPNMNGSPAICPTRTQLSENVWLCKEEKVNTLELYTDIFNSVNNIMHAILHACMRGFQIFAQLYCLMLHDLLL